MILIRTYSYIGEDWAVGKYLSFPHKEAQYDLHIGWNISVYYCLDDYNNNCAWKLNEINPNV